MNNYVKIAIGVVVAILVFMLLFKKKAAPVAPAQQPAANDTLNLTNAVNTPPQVIDTQDYTAGISTPIIVVGGIGQQIPTTVNPTGPSYNYNING